MQKSSFSSRFSVTHAGFTLIELLAVVAIISLLALVALLGAPNQIAKSQDAKRKSDLDKIKTAFEQYAYDKGTYPTNAAILNTCNGAALQPYLERVPCDPVTKTPYHFVPLPAGAGYRVLTTLQRGIQDPGVDVVGCNPTCGVVGATYNFGVAAKTTVCIKDPNNNCPNTTGF